MYKSLNISLKSCFLNVKISFIPVKNYFTVSIQNIFKKKLQPFYHSSLKKKNYDDFKQCIWFPFYTKLCLMSLLGLYQVVPVIY